MKLSKVELVISFYRHSITFVMTLLSWAAYSLILWQHRAMPGPELKTFAYVVVILNAPVFVLAVLPVLLILKVIGVVQVPNPFEVQGLVLAAAIAPLYWELYESLVVRRYGSTRMTDSAGKRQ